MLNIFEQLCSNSKAFEQIVVHTFNISTQEQRRVNFCEFQCSLVGITGQPRLRSETLSQEQQQKHHPKQTVQQDRMRTMDAHVLRHKKFMVYATEKPFRIYYLLSFGVR